MNITNVFIEAAIAHKKKLVVISLDIGSAYLNAKIKELVIMRIGKDFTKILCKVFPKYIPYVDENGCLYVELKKALYGCLESAQLWYEELKKKLLSFGFETNPYDPCVFTKDQDCTVLVYVDDLFIFATSQNSADTLVNQLQGTFKEITVNRGLKHSYLGMSFDFSKKELHITMQGYIESIIQDSNVQCTADTPAGGNLFQTSNNQPLLSHKEQKAMHTMVARLLYLATRVRPDLLLVINFLSTRVNKFTIEDKAKLTRCLKYLKKTTELGLRLSVKEDTQLIGLADASYGVHQDGRSQSANCFTLGSGSIYSSSSKQRITTKSSSEAELIAASDSSGKLLSFQNYLLSRNHLTSPAILGQDNSASKQMLEKEISS